MLKEKVGPNYNVHFTASSGWLKQFENRYSVHNVKVSGESLSTDVKAAEKFLETDCIGKLLARANVQYG